MSFRKDGQYSDFASVDDDSFTDENSNNNEKIIEKDREIRDLKSENAELSRKVIYLENSHGEECASQILKFISKEKNLKEELEFYIENYNQTMTSFSEFKRDVDNKNKIQSETIKNLNHKIKEYENLKLRMSSYVFKQNLPPTTSKDYIVEDAINCPSLVNKEKPGFFSRLFSRDSIITATWFLGFNTLIVVLFVHVYMFTQQYL